MVVFNTATFGKSSVIFFLAALVASWASQAACAQSLTFLVTGEFNDADLTNPVASVLSGTLTIDTAVGVATAIDLTVAGERPESFTLLNANQWSGLPGEYIVEAQDTVTLDFLVLYLQSPDDGTSLKGYSGGTLSASSYLSENILTGGGPLPIPILAGELVLIPEPATLSLLVSAFLVISGNRFLRWRQRTA